MLINVKLPSVKQGGNSLYAEEEMQTNGCEGVLTALHKLDAISAINKYQQVANKVSEGLGTRLASAAATVYSTLPQAGPYSSINPHEQSLSLGSANQPPYWCLDRPGTFLISYS